MLKGHTIIYHYFAKLGHNNRKVTLAIQNSMNIMIIKYRVLQPARLHLTADAAAAKLNECSRVGPQLKLRCLLLK